jgi:hypothetical protein
MLICLFHQDVMRLESKHPDLPFELPIAQRFEDSILFGSTPRLTRVGVPYDCDLNRNVAHGSADSLDGIGNPFLLLERPCDENAERLSIQTGSRTEWNVLHRYAKTMYSNFLGVSAKRSNTTGHVRRFAEHLIYRLEETSTRSGDC